VVTASDGNWRTIKECKQRRGLKDTKVILEGCLSSRAGIEYSFNDRKGSCLDEDQSI